MRAGGDQLSDGALAESPEAVVHDFFKSHGNHFPVLDEQAEVLREREPCEPSDIYFWLKRRFRTKHKIDVSTVPIDDMNRSLRIYDEVAGKIELSEALDFPNRTFQLAHMLALIEYRHTLDELSDTIDHANQTGRVRCRVELANYFAAAFLMPYTRFRQTAESPVYFGLMPPWTPRRPPVPRPPLTF